MRRIRRKYRSPRIFITSERAARIAQRRLRKGNEARTVFSLLVSLYFRQAELGFGDETRRLNSYHWRNLSKFETYRGVLDRVKRDVEHSPRDSTRR